MPNGRRISESEAKHFLRLAGKYHADYGLPARTQEDVVQTAVANTLRLAARWDADKPFLPIAAMRLRWEVAECARTWGRQQRRGRGVDVTPRASIRLDRIADDSDPVGETDAVEFVSVMLDRIENPKHRCALGLLASGETQGRSARIAGMDPARIPQLMKSKFIPLARELAGEETIA